MKLKNTSFTALNSIINKTISTVSWLVLSRIIVFEIIVLITISVIFNNSSIEKFKHLDILSLLVSTIAIITAIIITYLLSKLFAEKAERINRKHIIDELSYKVTGFRQISFHIQGMHDFWRQSSKPVKATLDNEYKSLTYFHYRNELEGAEFTKVNEEIMGTTGQAYLALKGLQNNENTFAFFQTFRPTNYTLEEIADFKEYSSSFWSFLDRNKQFTFDSVNTYSKEQLEEPFQIALGRPLNNTDYRKEIHYLFEIFEGEIFDKLYYLTKLNSAKLPKLFLSSFINLTIFIVILISSLILYSINITELTTYFITVLTIGLFIANTVDLFILLIIALKQELTIKDFYKI